LWLRQMAFTNHVPEGARHVRPEHDGGSAAHRLSLLARLIQSKQPPSVLI
jgi:hypothetical protein